MLKASSSGIVLTRLAHTNGPLVARPCPFHIQSRSSSFSVRFAAYVATATATATVQSMTPALAPAPRDARDRKHTTSYMPLARPAPARGTGMRRGADGVEGRAENARGTANLYGQLKTNTAPRRRNVRPVRARRPQGPSQKVVNIQAGETDHAKLEPDTERRKRPKSSISNSSLQTSRKKLHAQKIASNTSEDVAGVASREQDLYVRQLRAIILDKKSDLMGDAWDAYQRLVAIEADEDAPRKNRDKHTNSGLFGIKLLDTLSKRLVAERKVNRKNSREIFLRLLSVYARLRLERVHGTGVPYLRTPEWNSLIHLAGTGMRGKLSLEAYNAALDVFDDMVRGVDEAKAASVVSLLRDIEPDIYTYTTLLNIALRSEHQPAIDHALNLLKASNKEPTRITHLCMMRYRHRQEGLAGARAVLSSLSPDDVGEDGITAFMDCAGNDGDLTAIQNIYTALRQNVEVLDDGTFGALHSGKRSEACVSSALVPDGTEKYVSAEGIRFPRSLVPSAAIYSYVIQIFAYHGRLPEALQVFTEMLATRRPSPDKGFFQPSYPIFRAIFLGFMKHGYKMDRLPTLTRRLVTQQSEWTWDRFSVILDAFLDLDDTMEPSERMVYWIMVSVRKMTGDDRLLRKVWQRLNARWYIRKGGRLKDLDIKYGKPEAKLEE